MSEATEGKWLGVVKSPGDLTTHNDRLGLYGVHAVLMRTGRVLLFSGRVETAGYLYRSWTWDPTTFSEGDTTLSDVKGRWFLSRFDAGGPNASPPGVPPTWANDNQIDLFCAHHVHLEDGRVLVVGGAGGQSEGDARGNRAVFTYDPDAERWTKEPLLLQRGRWYPTAAVLADGRVVVVSGRKQTSGAAEEVAELLTPISDGSVLPSLQSNVLGGANRSLWIYPGLVMVPGGRVFFVPTNWMIETQNVGTARAWLEPTLALEVGTTSGQWRNFDDPTDTATPPRKISPSNPWREEGTFVLLPPAQAGRIMLIGGGWSTDALGSSGTQRSEASIAHCEILETQGATPRWVPAGKMHKGRVNVHAVLLPSGQVLILGGHDDTKRNAGHTDQLIAELYDPTVAYDPGDPSAAFTEVAAMGVSRNYHATALLLADGRVLVAGGEDTPHGGGNRRSIQIYEPPYCHQGDRSEIDPITGADHPDGEIAYGTTFTVRCRTAAQAGDVDEVVLMRPGAPTHHTDTEQRHVPLNFSYTGGTDLRVTAIFDPTVAPPGHYMLFVVDALGRPCQRAQWVRLSHRRCRLLTDRSTFSVEEIEAIPSRSVESAFYVHLEGFLPTELGITTPTPNSTQLQAWGPAMTFAEGATTETRIRARPTAMLLEDTSLPPGVRQRVTFAYTLYVDDIAAFPPEGGTERRTLQARIVRSGWVCHGHIHLMRKPDPYLLDGQTHWLSTDLRVLKVRGGESRFGRTLDASDPIAWLRTVLADFDGDTALLGHAFEGIDPDQAGSRLQIAQTEGGTAVFNFAIARVRYRSKLTTAASVRLHFRSFTVASTNLAWDPSTTYRTIDVGTERIAIPGLSGTEIVSIPYFGRPRVDLSTSRFADQVDDTNRKPMPAEPGGAETRRYFGALLDFNLSDSKLPPVLPSTATGPFSASALRPIAERIRGHQCLVAEVDYTIDPIQLGDTPANSDNLSQRNLAIEGSDNPGGPEAHTVAFSFDIDPTWGIREVVKDVRLPALNTTRAVNDKREHAEAPRAEPRAERHAMHDEAEHGIEPLVHAPAHVAQPLLRKDVRALGDRVLKADLLLGADPIGARFAPAHHEHAPEPRFAWFTPDELMIDWGELPEGTQASLFVPDLPSELIVRASQLRPGPRELIALDDRTVGVKVDGVSYVPLPLLKRERVAGLLTVTLPPTVRVGQRFTVTVRQLSMDRRVVVGAFELAIPVSTGPALLVDNARWYAVFQHIVATLEADSRWLPVLKRLLKVMAGRIRGFGGDPGKIRPTLDPADITEPGDRNHPDPCDDPKGHRPGDHADDSRPDPHGELCDEERLLCELLIRKYGKSR